MKRLALPLFAALAGAAIGSAGTWLIAAQPAQREIERLEAELTASQDKSEKLGARLDAQLALLESMTLARDNCLAVSQRLLAQVIANQSPAARRLEEMSKALHENFMRMRR